MNLLRKYFFITLLFILIVILGNFQVSKNIKESELLKESKITSDNKIIKNSQTNITEIVSNLRILFILGNGYGYNFFDLRDQFRDWNCDITIAGTYNEVTSCTNLGKTAIVQNVDLTFSEVNLTTIGDDYDCIIVPSGGHWGGLCHSEAVDVIAAGYQQGLVIASMCVGSAVLGASKIVNGTYVLYHANAASYIRYNGGLIIVDTLAVSDRNIVTGGIGGSLSGGGHTVAPTTLTCRTILRELLKYTYLAKGTYTLNSSIEGTETVYNIQVETTNLEDYLGDYIKTNISKVKVKILLSDNDTIITESELFNEENTDIFAGNFTLSKECDFKVIVEIHTEDNECEIVRFSSTYHNDLIVNKTNGFGFGLLMTGIISLLLGRRKNK